MISVMPVAYLVAGTPGVGKSAVARLLAERMGVTLIELAELVLPGELDVSAARLSARAGRLMRAAGRDAVIASHIVFKPRWATLGGIIVLRRNPLRLLEELRLRGYPEEKVLENVEAELLGVVHHESMRWAGRVRVVQIDTTCRGVWEAVELAYRGLRGEWVGEEVDWASRLEDEGRLYDLIARLSARRAY